MKIQNLILSMLMSLTAVSCTSTRPSDIPTPPRTLQEGQIIETNKLDAAALPDLNNPDKYLNNPDFLVLPSLIASRKTECVVFKARATGLKTNDIIEFILIGPNSGHDYESMAISLAIPSDIHRALEFIGMNPGSCIDYDKYRFWPKGETVVTFINRMADNKPPVRVEKLLTDDRTGKTLPEVSHVFTGSKLFPRPENEKETFYAADESDPGSIISTYNDRTTVLDVPLLLNQNENYGHLFFSPDCRFEKDDSLRVVVMAEYPVATPRVRNFLLKAAPAPAGNASGEKVVFTITEDGKTTVLPEKGLNETLKTFTTFVEQKYVPCVVPMFDDALTIRQTAAFCSLLETIESPTGIRIDPPSPGQLYYKAFNPNRGYLDRSNRIMHPWELRLSKTRQGITGLLTQIELSWKDEEASQPLLKEIKTDVADGAALRKAFDDDKTRKEAKDNNPNIPVILITADPDMTHGQLMDFIRPVLSTHKTIHVYTAE